MRTLAVIAIGPRFSVSTFVSGTSSSGWITTKWLVISVSSIGFVIVAMFVSPQKPALCGREQVRGRNLRGQNQRQGKKDDDDGPVHQIIPGLVRVLAQEFLIVQ